MINKNAKGRKGNKQLCMLLSSCDDYEDTWKPFFMQLKEYWPSFSFPVYLGTETKVFSFPGFDIRCPLSEGKSYKQWSQRLLKLLEHIDEEFILFMLDDFWLTDPVDITSFNTILEYVKENKQIGFVCLKQEIKEYSSAKDKANAVDCEYPELWECRPGKSFRITTQAGIWRKKYLVKLLRSHESAWYFETRATWRSKYYKERCFDTRFNVLTYPIGGSIGGGKLYEDYLPLYPESVYEETRNKRGTIQFGSHRTYPKDVKGLMYLWYMIKSACPKW